MTEEGALFRTFTRVIRLQAWMEASSMEEGALIVDARITWTTLKAFTCSDVHKPTWRPAPMKELSMLILMAACMKS